MTAALQPDITRGEKFVGLFVLGAIVIALGFGVLSNARQLQAQRHYYMTLGETWGLSRGDKVLLYGFEVGEIEEIELRDNRNIRLVFRVDAAEHYEQIRTDAIATIQAPLGGGTILAGALIVEPGDSRDVKGDMDEMAWRPPETTAATVLEDAAAIVTQFKELSERINSPEREGVLELLGRDNAEEFDRMIARVGGIIDEDIGGMSASIRHMVEDLDTGRRSLTDILFKGKPILQVLLGDQVQQRLDMVAAGEAALLEILVGPAVWNEVEVASRAWDTLFQSSLALVDETRILLRKTQVALDDIEPVLGMFGDNVHQLEEMLTTTNGMLSDLRTVTAAVSDVSDEVPAIARTFRGVLTSTSDLMEALKRNPLLRGFITPEPEEHYGLRQSPRPNPYGE